MAWPLGIPRIEGYDIGLESPVIETQMEQGPLRTVRLTNSYIDIINIVVSATDAELISFRIWYAGSEAKAGAGYFDMDLETSSGTAVPHSVRIMRGSVKISPVRADLWEIRLSVETQEHFSSAAGLTWNFDAGVESWTGTNATISHQSNGSIRITPITTDPLIRSPSGLSIDGGLNRYVRARVKLVSGATTSPQFAVYYVTSGHGESGSYFKSTADILSGTSGSNHWVTLEWDMHNLTAGGKDWQGSTITQIRLDFYQDNSTVVDVDWIAV